MRTIIVKSGFPSKPNKKEKEQNPRCHCRGFFFRIDTDCITCYNDGKPFRTNGFGGLFMKEECIICGAPLEYLKSDAIMECVLCHKKENSKVECINGHYVCDECHSKGIDAIVGLCLEETSKNPVEIIKKLMAQPLCHMHGPEHHIMVGASLLTAFRNAGGKIDLALSLTEMVARGKKVPGGVCGFWGACGAGISSGIFISILSGSTPLAEEPWGLSNRMTSKALEIIGAIGGPRCCKRDSFLAVLAAVDFVKEEFGVEMEKSGIVCGYSSQNNQCIGNRCPFSEKNF